MWWKTDKGNYINMKHMATLTLEKDVDSDWKVYGNEVAEQSRYLIKKFNSEAEAIKFMGDIIRAEK